MVANHVSGDVDAAVTAGRAACTDLRLYDQTAELLRMAAQRDFTSDFLIFFAAVDAATSNACAIALATHQPVLINDVTAVRSSPASQL